MCCELLGYPRLAQDHQTDSPDASNNADSAGSPRLISPLPATNSTPLPTPTPVVGDNIHSSIPTNHITNGTQTIDVTTTNQQDDRSHQTSPTEKKGRQPTRTTNVPTANADQVSGSIKDYLAKNTAFRPIANDDTEHCGDDDVLLVKATSNTNPHSIDGILLRNEQSGNLVNLCKEIMSGWPNSFAHADSDYFAKLATCYLIQFPSYMCYAVTALRVLTHALWSDNMFYGHIRELVLCAIGNGWTWTDQTAAVQGRRVSTAEICAAFASYMNQNAFPPGQISDLDTAIIAVCDDLFLDHCELFFASFKVNCLSCGANGQVSVPVFDSMLSVNLDDDTVDIAQMMACRNPRLALDRDDVGFSHASDCANNDQLCYDQIGGCLLFTLKISSPIEQLPPVAKTLVFLGQSLDVQSIGGNPVSQVFTVTGIIVVQGEASHHFLVIERCHQNKTLLYDNLQGYKWIPVEQLKATSRVWGFIFRQQNHQPYTFQPEQYKAIAPGTLNVNKQPPGRKQSKTRQKNPLGINARRYNFPKQPKKTSKNDTAPTNPAETPLQEQAKTPEEESLQHDTAPSHPCVEHSNNDDQHGVPMFGMPSDNVPHCPGDQHETATHSKSHHPEVLMVGDAMDTLPSGLPTLHEHIGHHVAEGQHGVPMVDQLASSLHVDTSHPIQDGTANEPPLLSSGYTADNILPPDKLLLPPNGGHEPSRMEHASTLPDVNANGIHGSPAAPSEPAMTAPISPKATSNHTINTPNRPVGKEKDASPPKRIKFSEVHPYAIISLFDGVGSAIPAIRRLEVLLVLSLLQNATQSSGRLWGNSSSSELTVNGLNPVKTPSQFMLTMYVNYSKIAVAYLERHSHWLGHNVAGLSSQNRRVPLSRSHTSWTI